MPLSYVKTVALKDRLGKRADSARSDVDGPKRVSATINATRPDSIRQTAQYDTVVLDSISSAAPSPMPTNPPTATATCATQTTFSTSKTTRKCSRSRR